MIHLLPFCVWCMYFFRYLRLCVHEGVEIILSRARQRFSCKYKILGKTHEQVERGKKSSLVVFDMK